MARVSAGKWLKAFTNLAPFSARETMTEEGRPPKSSGGTPNAFVTSITILPCQLGAALATSWCAPKGTAKMTIWASSTSRNDLGMIVAPIAFAASANPSGGPSSCHRHFDFFARERSGEGLADFTEPYDRVAH